MLMIDIIEKIPINKGWSSDKKYCVTDPCGKKYLVRITPHSVNARHEELFLIQKELEKLGVPMCAPVQFGMCDEGSYILQSWIDGEDFEDCMVRLTQSEKYAYGLEAGHILKKIHTVPAPSDQTPWHIRFNAKIDRKIKLYNDCPIKFTGAESCLRYIEKNRHLLNGRPQTFQHGDYHTGNMMLQNGRITIIDFDRYDFGDPWEEFNRIVWCAQCSAHFASGMVDGYFAGEVPDTFWNLLALYICSNTLSSVHWAVPFGDEQVSVMLNQANDVLKWYDDMKTVIPLWYIH